jgi:hypothetical protein
MPSCFTTASDISFFERRGLAGALATTRRLVVPLAGFVFVVTGINPSPLEQG